MDQLQADATMSTEAKLYRCLGPSYSDDIYLKLCECCKRNETDIQRFRRSWGVIMVELTLAGLAYFIALPSLHQFVTSSAQPADPNVAPGLGLSETWYSSIVSISSLGELLGALLPAFLAPYFFIKHVTLAHIAVCLLGGVLFGIGKSGWMLLFGRFLIGWFQGSSLAIMRLYIGESTVRYIASLSPEKQKKSNIKNTAFIGAFAAVTISVALGPGVSAVVAHIPHVDQFRWSGWWIAIHAFVVTIVVLVLFGEKWTDISRAPVWRRSKMTSSPPFIGITYLLFAFFVLNWCFAIPETLLNPILADNFGFSITFTSYVFLANMIFFLTAVFFMNALQRCGIDNRLIFMLGLLLLFGGCIVSSDWQSMQGDPCNQFSEYRLQEDRMSAAICCPNVTETSFDSSVVGLFFTVQAAVDSEVEIVDLPLDSLSIGGQSHDDSCSVCSREQMQETSAIARYLDNEYAFCCAVNGSTAREAQLECYLHGNRTDLCVQFSLLIDSEINDSRMSNSSDAYCGNNPTLYLALQLPENSSACLDEICSSYTPDLPNGFNTDIPEMISKDSVNASGGLCSANASVLCESFAGPPLNCFWNPHSRITGKTCPRCDRLCRSRQTTLNFVQFIMGNCLIFPGLIFGRLAATIILSDIMGTASQGLVMGVMVAVGSVARFTGPLWGNAAYHAAGQRTYLPMSLLALLISIVIVAYFPLYHRLKRKEIPPQTAMDDSSSPKESPPNSEEELEDVVAYDTESEVLLLRVHPRPDELEDHGGELNTQATTVREYMQEQNFEFGVEDGANNCELDTATLLARGGDT